MVITRSKPQKQSPKSKNNPRLNVSVYKKKTRLLNTVKRAMVTTRMLLTLKRLIWLI